MKQTTRKLRRVRALRHALLSLVLLLSPIAVDGAETLLNASYDISRELFAELNPTFTAAWKARTGQDIEINQSHQGSSRQARAILDGLKADVVTFNQETDIDALVKGGAVAKDWKSRLPNEASPYYSLTTFLVRRGNPKQIRDWDDLARGGVGVVFPNPKTSGNGRYTYLAAWAHAQQGNGGDEQKTRRFVGQILANVAVFDTGGRGSTTTFVERGIGDVLVTFEAEVSAIRKQYPDAGFEVVTPSSSVLATFPVSVVDRVVSRRGTRALAEAYLKHLFTSEAQALLARHGYRVRDPELAARQARELPQPKLFDIGRDFGGWEAAQEKHFANGASYDQLISLR